MRTGFNQEGTQSVSVTKNTPSSTNGSTSEVSAAELRQRCADRLEGLGIRPGITRRKLMARLRRHTGRPIKIKHEGEHGHLLHHPAAVSAMIDYRPTRRTISVWIADPRRSARGKHAVCHELSHLIVTPRAQTLVSHSSSGALSVVKYKCGCTSDEEREVEMTAYLLQRYMKSSLLPDDQPAASGLGLVLARRGTPNATR
jgi:hypothetical protein